MRQRSLLIIIASLVMVIVVLGISFFAVCASLAVVGYQQIQKSEYRKAARIQIDIYCQGASVFELDVGRYPASLDELIVAPADLPKGKWKGPYIAGNLSTDPWGRSYDYQVIDDGNGNQKVRIHSNGPDGIDGNTDDVSNIY